MPRSSPAAPASSSHAPVWTGPSNARRSGTTSSRSSRSTRPAPRPLPPGTVAPPATKRITLTGRPVFTDIPAQTSLASRLTTVIWLKPNPAPKDKNEGKEKTAKPAEGPGGGSSFSIEQLVALGDVRLTSPGKTLTARDRLDAVFEAVAPTAEAGRPAPRVVAVASAPAPARPAEAVAKAEDPKAKDAAPAKPRAAGFDGRRQPRLGEGSVEARRPLDGSCREDGGRHGPCPGARRTARRRPRNRPARGDREGLPPRQRLLPPGPREGQGAGDRHHRRGDRPLESRRERHEVHRLPPRPHPAQGDRPGPGRRQGAPGQGGNRRDDDQGPGDRPRPAHRPGVGRGRGLAHPARRQRPPLRQGTSPPSPKPGPRPTPRPLPLPRRRPPPPRSRRRRRR